MKKILCIAAILTFALASAVTAESYSYTIKKGDTLYSISRKYNIRIESLKSYNGITDPSKLYPGMTLNIPGGYTVKKGDTLYSIARAQGTTVDELLELNNLEPSSILKAGQFIHIPFNSPSQVNPGEGAGETVVESTQENPAADDPTQPATALVAIMETPDWPHEGVRTELTGKLKGIQITGAPGDDIVAVNGGTVVWASDYGIYNKLVLVEGQNGLVYGYGGNETTNVKVGDYVKPGSIIGILGGNSDRASVFFFVYKDGKPLDPTKAPRV
ncbi:MAG: M23 family metallopeptidase [Spirochaetales bacterium]|uniref:M23 family metallopeptidase n=1 Tax=Candidatus Thalassospirochaeta sargassi TaxID=3119039 RepID=A0AAJ1MKQ7_9SPIO|nr:M23 family metallopeptidase [Spirochaetales bacterium]